MNKQLLGWKAWYGDGSSYTSKDYKWADIPVNNFQYLKKFYHRNTDTFAGLDLFCITSDDVEIERLIKEDSRNIKIGKMMEIGEWLEFERQIEQDKEIIIEIL